MANGFAAVSRLLLTHIQDAEKRCRAFEKESGTISGVMRALTAAQQAQGCAAAARWWWNEYASLRDAVMSLIDGKIRHEYDRSKAERTPNDEGIHWQKASLRTGESQDNLRRLLRTAGRKHEGEFDALNLRIEDLQETIKRLRETLMQALRGSRVNKFGEETQELRLKLRGGGGKELRLLPPCGNGLEDCTCGESPLSPSPVRDGSLRDAVEAARTPAAAAASAASEVSAELPVSSRNQPTGNACSGDSGGDGGVSPPDPDAAAAGRNAKRRRVSDGPSAADRDDGVGRPGSGRALRAAPSPTSASDVPLDEIKRQMGKNPQELERRKRALEEETRTNPTHHRGGGGGGGTFRNLSEACAGISSLGEEGENEVVGEDGMHDCSGGARENERSSGRGRDGGEEIPDWRDGLVGLEPHEKAAAFEAQERFAEALRWHRKDLDAARSRALDGEQEDERAAALDLARALRNTGRCLGRLGNSGFAESKKLLTEACELVGHGGPFPSAADEQDVVLELGNLWYNRYCILSDEQGVCFLADEALDEALRFYGESRELCVDLVAETGDGVPGGTRTTRQNSSAPGEDETGSTAAAAAAVAGCLLRAEFNVGMSLFEQEKHSEAEPHLAAAAKIFRELFAEGARASEIGRPCGSGEGDAGASAISSWRAAVPTQEELAGLGAVYASTLSLLGSCLLASCALSPPTRGGPPGCAAREEEALRRRAVETLEASVEAFLEIDDRARAMEPLLKLVEALGLSADGESDRRLSETEALCDRVSSGLPLSLPSGEEPEVEEDEDLEHERSQLEQIREAIADLRARRAREAGSGGEPEGRTGATESSGRAQWNEHGESALGGNTGPSSPAPEFGRVGPVPTAGFALRRHRSRAAAAAAAAAASARNTAAAVGRTPASSSATAASSRKRHGTTGAPAVAASGGGGGRRGGAADQDGLGSAAGAGGDGGGGSARNQHLGREWEGAPSFTRLRAAVAVEDGTAALTAARGPRSEGRRGGEPGPPGRESLFDSYRVKCDYFQENPNPLAAARLALADRDTVVSSATSTTSNEPGNDSEGSSTPCPPVQPWHGTLDLAACRLTDREVRVLLHVVTKWSADPRSAGAASTAAAAGGARPGEGASTARSSGPPVRFSELLLGGNPGIGAGALRELWGGSSGSRAGKGPESLGLLRSLVRLDLSKCGLTAADLAGFTSKGGGRGSPSSAGEAPAVVCLRVLVLRDNPLTRIREGSAGVNGARGWMEPAQRGTAALRDLIARSPALELLDLSGCSQVPDGPAARLYSPQVSRLLASALSAGLEARVSGKMAADAFSNGAVFDERGSGGDKNGNGRGDTDAAGGPDDGLGRAQVATLRLGGNRFFRSSWRRLLEPLSSHPPRELDLSFATVVPRCSTAAGSVAAAGGGGGGDGSGGESSVASRDEAVVFVSTAVEGAAEGAIASPPEACLESGDASAPSTSQAAPAQSLGELLAAAVLPADSPGLETLDLTGSTGLLLVEDRRSHRGAGGSDADDTPEVDEPLPFPTASSSSSTEAFLLLLPDALASPLCRTTHLLCSGIRGSAARPRSTAAAPSGWLRHPSAFLPRHVESLCEAVSTCASLRCLDLAGCDLSGPAGAAAAAAAVACLIRNEEEEEDSVADTQDIGFDTAVASGGGGLDRLSLRACGLGASGLSAVVRSLVASPKNDRGPGRRRKGPLPRGGGAEEGEAAALTELAGSVRALEAEGLVSVVGARDPRRSIGRLAPALVDLSGNRLDF